MNKIAWDGYLFSQPDSACYFAGLEYELAEATENKKWMANALHTQGTSYYFRGDYEQALEYHDKSLKINEETGDKKGMARTLYNIGIIYFNQGNYEKALEYYQDGLNNFEEIGYKYGMASSYINIGIIYSNQGNYEKTLEYYDKSLKINEELGDKKGIAASYNDIGLIYAGQSNHEQALEYYDKSLKINKEIVDKKGIAASYNNIGIIYYDQGNHDQALDYYDKSLKIDQETGNNMGMANTLNNIGLIYHKQGNHEQALDYYDKSLKINEELGDKKRMANTLNNIGNIYKERYNFAKAIDYGSRALSLAKEIGAVKEIKEASAVLFNGYKKTGQPARALEMYELHIEMRDSLNSIENKEAAIKLTYQHTYEKEKEISEAKHQNQMILSAEREEWQQQISYIIGGALITVILIAFFIYNRLQVTHKQKKLITEQKQKAEEQNKIVLEQKQELMKQKKMLEEQNKDITDSIRYAKNIQKSLLPTDQSIQDLFKRQGIENLLTESFILFKPKDIVSGDFFWMQHYKNRVYFAACDCTGHGVPGAFMSMIGSSLLDQTVLEMGITQPNEIFSEVRKGLIETLKQTEETQKDGMDAVLLSWDKKNKLEFALAYNPLLLIRKGEIIEFKPDKQPVGFHMGQQKPFTHHELILEKEDTVYIFSDGYIDQFGGPKQRKFMLKNFKKLLLSIDDKTMDEQKTILKNTLAEWKGDTEQVDDILVMGVRF